MSDKIDELVATRRKHLGRDGDRSGKWGLALSGGGIRSATFCFGLLAALSRNRLLGRFDLLSTVSGGGYIGAMLGRLLGRATDAAEVRLAMDALGSPQQRWFHWWLRANGRYLTPKGAADRLFAATIYLRNLPAVHLEFGAVALLLGADLGFFDVLVWSGVALYAELMGPGAAAGGSPWFDVLRGLSDLLPTPWLLLLLLFPFMTVFSCAYWVVPWVAASRRGWMDIWVVVAGALAFGVWQYGTWFAWKLPGAPARAWLAALMAVLFFGWLVAIPWVAWTLHGPQRPSGGLTPYDEESVRRGMTDKLRGAARLACITLLVGLVDRVAWLLAFEYRDLVGVGLWLALVAAVLRVLAPVVASLNPGVLSTRGLLTLAQLGGYLLVFLLCAWWVSVVQRAALGTMFRGAGTVDFVAPLPILALIGGGAVAYLLFTGRNFEFLNLSSLHTFYRARLARSYLGAANPRRFNQRSPLGATEVVPDGPDPRLPKVYSPDPDDDVAMDDYAPHRWGGPVHLINVCLNQTRDPRGGLFNQDRRGQALTVAPEGWVRVGRGAWQQFKGPAAPTLGAWTAISGAAIAPGLGASTRGGLSSLLAFAGMRLGYWWTAEQRGGKATAWRRTSKSEGLLGEVFASFEADDRDDWFLSDGGHFENTGVHALLAEEAEFIVVADCGADPDYRFGDLENLVRKARIDFSAEITFLKPRDATVPPPAHARSLRAFGALAALASADSTACLALARVVYSSRRQGLMVVVKPNLCDALPVDLLNFAADNPSFPQQTTADLFFDEAQWESYYQLGQILGLGLTPAFVDWLRVSVMEFFEADCGVLAERTAAGGGAVSAQGLRRLPAQLRTGAAGATLGLGGVLALGVPLWSEIQKVLGVEEAHRDAEAKVLEEMARAWVKLPPQGCDPPKVAAGAVSQIDALAEVVLRNSDTLCADGRVRRQRWSLPARQILEDAVNVCSQLTVASKPRSCVRLQEFVLVVREMRQSDDCLLDVLRSNATDSRPLYWGYAYAIDLTRAPDLDRIQAHATDPDVARLRVIKDDADRARVEACATLAAPAAPVKRPPGAPASGKGPAPAPAKPAPLVCAGNTIYVQIYGPEMRKTVEGYREPWRLLGASVPPIEDVFATADSKRRPRPVAYRTTTVLYHDKVSRVCAEQLAEVVGEKRWAPPGLLPQGLRPTPGVIEVWVANPESKSAPP